MTPETPFKHAARPILGGKVNFPVCLAPMVGLSHVALRTVVREYLPRGAVTLWPTEMLNSRKLPHEDLATTPETLRAENEDCLVPQLLGNDPGSIRASVRLLKDWGAEGIDINMGCSVMKALRHNYGVSLMGDPGYAAEVVRMTVEASDLPVSVKLRAGLQNDLGFLEKFVRGLEAAGASWLTLHPRTAEQLRRGSADWSQIRHIREQVQIPVIGNGDVQTADDAFAMREATGCDAVMVGRALAARPWMLWQVGERLGFPAPAGFEGRAPASPEEEGREYGRVLLRMLELHRRYFPEALALRKLRFHVRTTHVWLPFGHTVVSLSTKGKTLDEVEELFRKFFSVPVEMSAKTELRQ